MFVLTMAASSAIKTSTVLLQQSDDIPYFDFTPRHKS
jgi:hypothetical protein